MARPSEQTRRDAILGGVGGGLGLIGIGTYLLYTTASPILGGAVAATVITGGTLSVTFGLWARRIVTPGPGLAGEIATERS